MIDQKEADALAVETLEGFINDCDCKSLVEVSKTLITMLTTVGASLNATQGQERTAKAFDLLAIELVKPQYANVARIERVN